MLASTDALAVSAIVRSAGCPDEEVVTLMEGESLFNDATSLVVFTVFQSAVNALGGSDGGDEGAVATMIATATATPAQLLPGMFIQVCRLSIGGALVGWAAGYITLRLLRVLRRWGAQSFFGIGIIQAGAFLSFYIANSPLQVSGVISVVVFGLYGAATSKFEYAHSGAAAEQLEAVLSTLTALFTGFSFFLGGATASNFLIRAISHLHGNILLHSIAVIPVVYIGLFTIRFIGILVINTLFYLFVEDWRPLEWRTLPFVTWGGLRGALSLVMAMVVVAEHRKERTSTATTHGMYGDDEVNERITAQIVAWTSSIVLMTLVMNAPTLPLVLKRCGLLEIPAPKAALFRRARKALVRRTHEAIEELKHDEDELLRGVDWAAVKKLAISTTTSTSGSYGGVAENRSTHSQSSRDDSRETSSAQAPSSILAAALAVPLLATTSSSPLPQSPAPPRASSVRARRGVLGRFITPQLLNPGVGESLIESFEVDVDEEEEEEEGGDLEVGVGSGTAGTSGTRAIQKTRSGAAGLAAKRLMSIELEQSEQAELEAALNEALEEARRAGPFARASVSMEESPFMAPSTSAAAAKRPPQPQQQQLQQLRSSGAGPSLGIGRRSSRHVDEWSVAGTSEAGGNDQLSLLQNSSSGSGDGGGSGGGGPGPGAGGAPGPSTSQQSKKQQQQQDDDVQRASSPPQPSSPLDPLRPSESDMAQWWGFGGGHTAAAGSTEQREQEQQQVLDPPHTSPDPRPPLPPPDGMAESRARLVGGIKRYIFAKRSEGLLSPQGAQILGQACDAAIASAHQELAMWAEVQAVTADQWTLQAAAWISHSLRRSAYALPPSLQRIAVPVVSLTTRWLRDYLSTAMLRSCEVAVTYLLALTYSNQAQWLRQVGRLGSGNGASSSPPTTLLLNELEQEQMVVSRFVVDREIEAPAHFQAIQTYRAAMAVLRRQQSFVSDMFSAGVIDEGEQRVMVEPIEMKMRALEAIGPDRSTWPKPVDVISSLPFFSRVPRDFLLRVVRVGGLKEFAGGEVVWSEEDEGGTSGNDIAFSVVVRGLVRTSTRLEDGSEEARFFGSGSVLGLVPAVTGRKTLLPGGAPAIAETSDLQKGVLVFQLPSDAFRRVQQTEEERTVVSHVLLNMYKEAAMQVLDTFTDSTVRQLAHDWEVAAIYREQQLAAEAHRAQVEAGITVPEEEEAAKERATKNILLSSKGLWMHATSFGHRTLALMRRRLKRATVVDLAPYQTYRQVSHVLLLSGAVQVRMQNPEEAAGYLPATPARGLALNAKIHAPAVLPLCTHLNLGNIPVGRPRTLLSGHEGAFLVVWPVPSVGGGGGAAAESERVAEARAMADLTMTMEASLPED